MNRETRTPHALGRFAASAQFAPLTVTAFLLACGPFRIISPYDQILDKGLQDYKVDINVLLAEAGKSAGTSDGAFDAFKKRYTDLEVRADVLTDRARIDEIDDLNCELDAKTLDQIKSKFAGALDVLHSSAAPAPGSNSKGCMQLLLENVKKQLQLVEKIHSTAALCAWPEQPTLTCMRPAAGGSALSATNQTLDAALLVQAAKRKGELK